MHLKKNFEISTSLSNIVRNNKLTGKH